MIDEDKVRIEKAWEEAISSNSPYLLYDSSSLPSFYKVKYDGKWTVLYYDGKEWYDHISGQYSECNHEDFIEEIGERIDLSMIGE